jgi:periplasmic copper chaperone A
VSVQPTPGWTFTAKKTKLAKPITTDDGPITTTISQVTWTTSGGGIKPGEFQQFFVSLGPLPKASSVSFPALQYYSDGSVVKWIEKAAPGSSAEPEHPAPTLALAAGSADGKTAGSGDNASGTKVEKASTTGPTVLAIVALVVAAGAFGFAFVTRARAKAAAP